MALWLSARSLALWLSAVGSLALWPPFHVRVHMRQLLHPALWLEGAAAPARLSACGGGPVEAPGVVPS